MPTALQDKVSTSLPETAFSVKESKNYSINNGKNMIRLEDKPHEAFDSDSGPVLKDTSVVPPTITNSQPGQNTKISPDQLNNLLHSFHQFVAGNSEITSSGMRS
jgi:hypothetical protein